jgi:DNA-directed RNA polymerase subunit N (RpoN/RPB10)
MVRMYLDEKKIADGANNTHINYNMLNPATDIDMSHIFAALGLEEKKYCCKTRLTASVQFHDLEVQNRI